jgi:uncharacterized protein YceH (UPF0502 family)
MSTITTVSPSLKPAWQPLTAIERRVLGVLVEKAKTTPDAYPLSLNAIRTGCNQKSNRFPAMDLQEDAVQEAVDSLRHKGVAIEVQGGGRVAKYRHMAYEWLGVDKREIAIMTELLLRGAQTVGELRGHAARMEPIADLAALQPLLDGLIAKGLVIALTPAGRGQVVAHALYHPSELQRLRTEHSGRVTGGDAEDFAARERPYATASQSASVGPRAVPIPAGTPPTELTALRQELADAKTQIAQLREELQSLREKVSGTFSATASPSEAGP